MKHLPHLLLAVLIASFALFFSTLALQQHATFQTNGLDLGNVDQTLWNTAHGRFLQFSLMWPIESRLALHVEPILLVFVPFYWLNLGGPTLLLVSQASFVALGAWPLYLIARHELLGRGDASSKRRTVFLPYLCLIFPLVYLLLPTLESAVLFDFHAVTLAPTFILLAWYALLKRWDKRFILFIMLTMACKEDMPLLIGMLGLYIALVEKRYRLAGITIALSLVWFVVALFVIQPQFAAQGNIQLDRYAWLGDSPTAIISTILTQPDLIVDHLWHKANLPNYLSMLFYPTAFLALFSPLTLLPILPNMAINLLSDNPFTWRLEDFHYGAPFAPFILIATLQTVSRVNRWLGDVASANVAELPDFTPSPSLPRTQQASPPLGGTEGRDAQPLEFSFVKPMFAQTMLILLIALMLICSVQYHYYRGFTPPARPFLWPVITSHHEQVSQFLATIPPDMPLLTQPNLAPHLTHRAVIYNQFDYLTDPTDTAQPVAGILFDLSSIENIGAIHEYLAQTLTDSETYRVQHAQDGLLYLTVDPSPDPPPDLTVLFRPSPYQHGLPTYSLPADFGEQIRLHTHSLHFNRQEEVELTVELEALAVLSADLQAALYLLDESGQPVGVTTDLQPLQVWLPPDTWQIGERILLRFNTLPWYTRETPTYRLALGMVQGDDLWNMAQRLRPQINQPTSLSPRIVADGTLLEVARFEQVWGMPNGTPLVRQFQAPDVDNLRQDDFSGLIQLVGHDPISLIDDQLSVTLHWQADTMLTNPLPHFVRFVQLIGPDGQLYGQYDSPPDNGHYPTPLWQPSEVISDMVSFPVNSPRPTGNYMLHVGFYNPDTGERLPLTSGADHGELLLK
ncbi:DUF2079 domain-containing protein [Anaerolineales bacterium HSG6]|nr:DUF2079 domain-containing protein [Anaerolineales bacterium HSG6]